MVNLVHVKRLIGYSISFDPLTFTEGHYIPDEYHSRASFGTKSNNFGTKLLDICKSTGMRIVNGRVGKDQHLYLAMVRR